MSINRFYWLCGFLAFFVVGSISLMAYSSFDGPTPVPNELCGLWATQDPDYRDRYFSVSQGLIVISMGKNLFNVYHIDSVTQETVSGRAMYHIAYSGDDVKDVVSLYYDAGKGSITLKSQRNMEWRRESF